MLIRANNGDVFDTDDAIRFDEQLWWNGYAMVGKFSYLANENCRQILFGVAGRYYLTVITPAYSSEIDHLVQQHAHLDRLC